VKLSSKKSLVGDDILSAADDTLLTLTLQPFDASSNHQI
jgi:hypothetical protein